MLAESSILILIQEIVAFNLYAAFLCDKGEDFLLLFLICVIKSVPRCQDRTVVEMDDMIRPLDDLAVWSLDKPDRSDSCDLIVIVSDFAKAPVAICDYPIVC